MTLQAGLKFSKMEHGELFVTMNGTYMTHKLYAKCWDTIVLWTHHNAVMTLVEESVTFFFLVSAVPGVKLTLLNVHILKEDILYADTERMPVSIAQTLVCKLDLIIYPLSLVGIDHIHMTSQKGAPACWGQTRHCHVRHRQACCERANSCMPYRRAGPVSSEILHLRNSPLLGYLRMRQVNLWP